MPVTLGRKATVVALTAGLVVAGIAGTAATVSYAAGSSSSVLACANGKHQLGVASKKGKCAKGFKKVTLATQGPRGPQGVRGVPGVPGKQGAQGEKGAAGPGAVKLLLQTSDSGNTAPLPVGSFSYQLGCDATGNSANATVYVNSTAPGVTGVLSTQYSYANNDSLDPITKFYRTAFTTTTQFHSSATNGVQRTYIDSMRVIGSDGTVQLLTLELNADGRTTPAGERCVIAGSVTPAY